MPAQKTPFGPFKLEVLRWYALCIFAFSVAFLALNVYSLDTNNIAPFLIASIVVHSAAVVIACYLFARPGCWPFFVLVHIIQGLHFGVFAGEIMGLMIYSVGWLMAYHVGFFEKYAGRKLVLCALPFLVMMSTQLFRSPRTFFIDLAETAVFVIMFTVIYLLFQKDKAPETAGPGVLKPPLVLKDYGLTGRDIAIIRGIEKGLSYQEIGGTVFLSESSIKQHAHRIFAKFKAANLSEFHHLLAEHHVEY